MHTSKKIAIIGTGNIGSAIANGLVQAKTVKPSGITVTRRSIDSLTVFKEKGLQITSDNIAAVKASEIIILSMTPQQMDGVLEEIKEYIDPNNHIVLSVVSGASIEQIKTKLVTDAPVVRVMPNTAIAIRESMTCISGDEKDSDALSLACSLFNDLGKTVVIHEELMVPATALCACGIAFFFRAIRAASQGGIEIGFHAEDALAMAAQTAKSAATLLLDEKSHPEGQVDKVTTPMGCTISGLNQMEHSGFSSSMIKGIITSAEKAETLYSSKGM